MISLIACVGKNLEIGKAGQLAFTGRGELGYFKSVTMNHKVLMGFKTYQSLPGPLPGRQCYLVTHHPNQTLPSWVHPISDLKSFLENYQKSAEELFVIGGATIYAATLDYADRLYLTEVDATCPQADTFFPNFDPAKFKRRLVAKGAFSDGITFSRYIYSRKP